MLTTRSAALALAAVLPGLIACERPFVPLDPPSIDVVSPDLSEVIDADRVAIVFRITAPRGVADVTVNGERVSAGAGADLYVDTLQVADGLNTFIVEARGDDGNVATDTLFAFRMALETGITPTGDLPEARALHSATSMSDGSVAIAGGVGPDGLVRSEIYLLRETTPFTFTVAAGGALAAARAGHSASGLSDGRVIIVGGASTETPHAAEDFVAQPEILDPATGTSTPIATRGDPVRRSRHLTFVLTSAGRTFLYIVGGRGTLGDDVGTPASVIIAELRGPAGADTLVTLTPPGGAGVLSPVTAPAGAPLPPRAGNPRALVTGLYDPEASVVVSRLVFLPGTSLYPFQVLEQRPPAPGFIMSDAAVAPFGTDGTALVTIGGRDAAGVVGAGIGVYVDAADRFFSVPLARTALRVSRFGHTATLLPSGRIAVVGGYPVQGAPTAASEVIYRN